MVTVSLPYYVEISSGKEGMLRPKETRARTLSISLRCSRLNSQLLAGSKRLQRRWANIQRINSTFTLGYGLCYLFELIILSCARGFTDGFHVFIINSQWLDVWTIVKIYKLLDTKSWDEFCYYKQDIHSVQPSGSKLKMANGWRIDRKEEERKVLRVLPSSPW